jgi:hypothetical protein
MEKHFMAKKLQFKAPHGRLVHPTIGEVSNDNLTKELYDRLVAEAEGHKELFEEVEEEVKKSDSKPKKNE